MLGFYREYIGVASYMGYARVGGAARVDVSVVRELKHVLLVRAITP